MPRLLKILLLCIIPAGPLLLAFSPAGSYFWQNFKSSRLREASQSVPTVTVDLGVIPPDNSGDVPGIARAIQRLSAELKKNKKQVNIDITWALNTNPDDMPAVVSYYNPSQMLEYSPEVLGITFRYEDVTPNLLHALAKQHANNFHELTKQGCIETPYEND